MLTFNAKIFSSLTAAVVIGVGTANIATQAESSGAATNHEVVVAASIEAAASNLPGPIEGPAPTVAATAATAPAAQTIEDLPLSERAHAWFLGGVEAYNAGDGRLTVERWTKAADRGHLVAQWNLARLYRRGDLVAADPVKALTYFRIVANQHDPSRVRDQRSAITVAALVEVADIYRAGEPLAKLVPDPNRAAALYNVAAKLYGDARAQHRLGIMYLTGEGVRQHIGRAVRWLGLSASKRYAPSLVALGDFFWQNRETGDNKVQGLMWLSLARENAKGEDLRAVVNDRYEAALIEANDEERKQAMSLIQSWNQIHRTQ
ncbi:hypothetical protein MNBD_ALPHA09-408 [hydrothermal vent metagenome]|uniref:FOG: TPR repeat, SEL1 subfamily n=1 Tax=hydrothermal vent metagenome TaxID=652676 RepID=A0A3B0SYG5_9ZZZZ